MRQYFKDIKAKIQKEQEIQAGLSFQVDAESEFNKGVFLKKKSQNVTDERVSIQFQRSI